MVIISRRIAQPSAKALAAYAASALVFPSLSTKAIFALRGHRFAPNDWALIDIYGTNRDARTWGDADTFRPERFREQPITAYNFIPHGGGKHCDTHRCPGEWISVEQMKGITRLLVREMRYDVRKDPLRPLTADERQELTRLSRSLSAPAAQVERSRALLAIADGASYAAAAHQVGRRHNETISAWVSRFNRDGLAAVRPGHGGGPRIRYGADAQQRILAEWARQSVSKLSRVVHA